MAENAILNEGAKYLYIVKEDTHAVEKWNEFKDAAGNTPPAAAIKDEDYIAIGAAGDDLGKASQTGKDQFYQDPLTGRQFLNPGIRKFDPSIQMLGSLKQLFYILKTAAYSNQTVQYPITVGSKTFQTTILALQYKQTTKPNTIYLGEYTGDESKVRGCQVNEINGTFNKGDGIVPVVLNFLGSKFKRAELKDEGTFTDLLEDPVAGWMLDGIYIFIGESYMKNRFIENADSYWQEVGCNLTDPEFDFKFNLDEDSGSNNCTGANTNKNILNLYRGELTVSDFADYVFKFSAPQTTSRWKQLEMGGLGVTEYMDEYRFGVRFNFVNNNGEALVIGAPSVVLTTDGPKIAESPKEDLEMTSVSNGTFWMDINTQISGLNGAVFAHYYPTGYYASKGICLAEITLLSPTVAPHNFSKSRILIRRQSDHHLFWFRDISDLSSMASNQQMIMLIKLFAGTYDVSIRYAADPSVEVATGCSFTIDPTFTDGNPKILNGLNNQGGEQCFRDYFGTALQRMIGVGSNRETGQFGNILEAQMEAGDKIDIEDATKPIDDEPPFNDDTE